ncbi:hypothetical protein [Pedobacter nototheniae]|uniref:hypothetical protein n=1 Tax=Pedobacter nototheniae TaxID=2488994 RepID=UPI00292EB85A|nr:hypothetical protein [Pedobacter nototheniae]
MKYSWLILLITVLNAKLAAQTLVNDSLKKEKVIRICTPSRTGFLTNQPLYVVNKKEISNTDVQYLGVSKVKGIKIVNGKDALAKYGYRGNNGAIEITLNNDVKVVSIADVLKKFKIHSKNWNLPVFVEQRRLVTFNDFYIVEDKVKNVEFIKTEDKLSGKLEVIKISLKP